MLGKVAFGSVEDLATYGLPTKLLFIYSRPPSCCFLNKLVNTQLETKTLLGQFEVFLCMLI